MREIGQAATLMHALAHSIATLILLPGITGLQASEQPNSLPWAKKKALCTGKRMG